MLTNPAPSKGYNPRDRIKIVKEELRRLQTDDKNIDRAEAELQQVIQERAPANVIAQKRENLKIAKEIKAQAITSVKQEIAKLQAEIDEMNAHEQKQREEIMAAQKVRALDAWLSSGGSETEFEIAWPKIREHLLTQATINALNPGMEARRREYSAMI